MSYSIDTITQQLQYVSLENYSSIIDSILIADTDTILRTFYEENWTLQHKSLRICELNNNVPLKDYFFQLYPDEARLFGDIEKKIFSKLGRQYFLEICPLLDEYIELIYK
jgi:hypothetical protein